MIITVVAEVIRPSTKALDAGNNILILADRRSEGPPFYCILRVCTASQKTISYDIVTRGADYIRSAGKSESTAGHSLLG